ncbi:MAG: shikimate kinase [Desulfuromonas sp.]|nr:shikimate kinase [Desulfuromonas sp.]
MVHVKKSTLFLTGFMGAGKSTVGRCLARRLGYHFDDLDQLIVAREGRPIPEIFATRGEAYFRDCETAVLTEQAGKERTVFATGGGIVGREENRALMKQHGRVVYLRAAWPTLENRLSMGSGRPLADPQQGWDAIRELWESRLPWYEEAEVVVDTDHLEVEAVVNEIISRLELEGHEP